MIRAVVFAGFLLAGPAALAQQDQSADQLGGSTASGGSKSMGDLLSEGYEIKTSVPNGTKFIVFMQKDKSAYACEFVSLTRSRCGSIN
ncbi:MULTISPECIES: hypothetical protein [Rhizobium/Agrobacterium group]|uniref:Uncharacterized protein n=2 Tax=Neorhizobium TaxID=1525371 RepID=A0ABV0M3G9_9HYPH|nr:MULTISPECIES: hypothetical protein [Rhizobium/Agrobacterium group]MBP1844394.1 hypothetical protein [Neorhizobium petrolearium]MCC2609511.1 hypothetical protein [Neorhizobium petrolearium]WGI69718.1 hypothetical protein QEO92_06540 [Neorhizobium petrolearium]